MTTFKASSEKLTRWSSTNNDDIVLALLDLIMVLGVVVDV